MKTNTAQQNIPSGWQENKLLDCLRVPSKLAGIKLSEYEKEGDFPVFDQGQDYISGFSSNKDLVVKDVPAILFGDHTRIVKYIKGPFVAGADGTKIFWAKDGFDPTFLYYLILSQKIPNTGYNRHFKFFKDIKVVLPESKMEQKKIAEILGTVDEDIAKTQKVIEATEKLKRGLMQQLFTRGIGHMKFKETKFGQIPEEWEIIPLGEVTKFIDYRGKTPKKTEGGIPLITAKNVRQGYVSAEPREYIAESDYDGWMTRGIPKVGDVLFTTEAPLGYVAQIDTSDKIALAQRIITIQSDVLNHVFLKYMLTSQNIQNAIQALGTGGTVKGIKASVLKKLEVPKPSPGEQTEIAEILSDVDEKISINKQLKAKLTLLKKGLMQDLLSGTVRTNI